MVPDDTFTDRFERLMTEVEAVKNERRKGEWSDTTSSILASLFDSTRSMSIRLRSQLQDQQEAKVQILFVGHTLEMCFNTLCGAKG